VFEKKGEKVWEKGIARELCEEKEETDKKKKKP